MALPSGTTINNLTRCKTLPGFFPGGFCDQFIRKIPFEEVSGYGRQVQINRATLGAATNYDPGAAMALVASAAGIPPAFLFQRIGDSVEVDTADITSSDEGQNQLDLQIQMKRVAVIRRLANQVVQGNGVAPNLVGLREAVDPTQEFDPQVGPGTAPTLDDYHRLLTKVCASDGAVGAGPDALVMHPRTRRQLISRLEAAAGGAPAYAFDEGLGVPVLQFEGIPVFFSDQVSTEEDAAGDPQPGVGTFTSVYALKLTGPTAVRVLHEGGDPDDFGIIVERIPPQLGTAVEGATVRGQYTLLVPEIESLARLRAIDISGFPA